MMSKVFLPLLFLLLGIVVVSTVAADAVAVADTEITRTTATTTTRAKLVHSIIRSTNKEERLLRIRNKNIVKAILGESFIAINQLVFCTLTSSVPVNFNRNSYKIVSSYQLNTVQSINDATNYYKEIHNGAWNTTWAVIYSYFDFEKLLGPIFDPYYNDISSITNVSIVTNWTERYGSFHFVHYNTSANNITDAVLGISEPYYVGYKPEEQLKIFSTLQESYYPGQTIVLNVLSEYYYSSYYKIFKVSSDSTGNYTSYRNNPYLLNSAIVVHTSAINRYLAPTTHTILIDWAEPGLYQIVMFTQYNQTIISISNVFTINPVTSIAQHVTTDSGSYFAGQNITFSISRPNGVIFDSVVNIALLPASQSFYLLSSSFQQNQPTYSVQWDITKSIMNFTFPTNPLQNSGWYKIVPYIGTIMKNNNTNNAIRLGVSNRIQVKRTEIQIILPKRTITLGETINFSTYTPYFPLESFASYYSGYRFVIVPHNYDPNNNATKSIYTTRFDDSGDIYNSNRTVTVRFMNLKPGTYKFALLYYTKYDRTVLYTIQNTTFQLQRNSYIVSTDKSRYRIGDKMIVSLTSLKKVPLLGLYQTWFDPRSDYPPYSKYIPIQNEQDDTSPSSILNETTIVDWQIPGEYTIMVSLEGTSVYSKSFTISN